MTKKKPFQWSSAGRSHVGMVRAINEDACLVLPELGLWVVADGMGGHEAGDIASRMIVEPLQPLPPPADWPNFLDSVREGLCEVNRRLREESAQRYHHRTIGSTVVVLIAYETQCACLWVGDSRIYRLREGQLQQLTRDHTWVEDMVLLGSMSREDAENHPNRHMLTRAIGTEGDAEPDVFTFSLREGDVYLVCSDGLTNHVDDTEIGRILNSGGPSDAAWKLVGAALVGGGSDNTTCIVVRLDTLKDVSEGTRP